MRRDTFGPKRIHDDAAATSKTAIGQRSPAGSEPHEGELTQTGLYRCSYSLNTVQSVWKHNNQD